MTKSTPGTDNPGSPVDQSMRRCALERDVRRFGYNSTSYVLLEGKKKYYCSPRVEGFISYQLSAGVAVIGGDPVCAPADAATLLKDFMAAVGPRPVCAYQVTPEMLPAFRRVGFDDVQIGNEAIFAPGKFTLAGGAMELVRAATNKASREGVVVSEHDPFAPGAARLNDELRAVSEEWLRSKGSRELGFLLGGLNLEQRTAKRYFVARSAGGRGRIEGFVVCEPIYARRGYYLDVTRRRRDAVRGTMELLTSEIFRQLRDEGCEMASMGLAPLANIDDPDLERHPRLTRLMRFAYERIESSYDFKQLYRYKAKYHPQAWERRYLCFSPNISLRILFATLRVRDAFTWRELFNRQQPGAPIAASFSGRVNLERRLESCKHAASFVIGLCSALLLSS